MQGAYYVASMIHSNDTFFYPFVGETGGRKDEEGLKPPRKKQTTQHVPYLLCFPILRRDP